MRFTVKGNVESPIRYCTNHIIDKMVSKYCPKTASILDVGCGSGAYRELFLTHGIEGEYLGIDIKRTTKWQNETINNLRLTYVLGDVEDLNYDAQHFDFIMSIQMLEHVKNDNKALTRMTRCLVENGYLLLTVPSIYSYILYGSHGYRRYSRNGILDLVTPLADVEIVHLEKIGGLGNFVFHFFLWNFFSIGKKIKIWKFYSKYQLLSKAITHIEHSLLVVDKLFPVFEGGYALVIRKKTGNIHVQEGHLSLKH